MQLTTGGRGSGMGAERGEARPDPYRARRSRGRLRSAASFTIWRGSILGAPHSPVPGTKPEPGSSPPAAAPTRLRLKPQAGESAHAGEADVRRAGPRGVPPTPLRRESRPAARSRTAQAREAEAGGAGAGSCGPGQGPGFDQRTFLARGPPVQ